MTAWYTDNSEPLFDKEFAGSSGTWTFVVGRDADIKFTVISLDEAGVYSEPNDPVVQVDSCDLKNTCNNVLPFDIPLWVVLVIIGLIVLLLALVRQIPWPIWARVILLLMSAVFFLLAFIVYPV